MKKMSASLLALSLFAAVPTFAAEQPVLAAVPAAIAQHSGPVRIAVIRNLGSDDNTTQFLAGAIKQGRALGFKVDTFLSNGDDAKFQDFVNQAISQKYDGIILSQGRGPYSNNLVKHITAAGIAVSVFDTEVTEGTPGVTVTRQDDTSLTKASMLADKERLKSYFEQVQATAQMADLSISDVEVTGIGMGTDAAVKLSRDK